MIHTLYVGTIRHEPRGSVTAVASRLYIRRSGRMTRVEFDPLGVKRARRFDGFSVRPDEWPHLLRGARIVDDPLGLISREVSRG